MDRSQLLRQMPCGKNDIAACHAIVAFGFPTVNPVLPDIVRWFRVHDAPVAKEFARFLAANPEHCWSSINQELAWGRNDAIKHVIVAEVLRDWPREWIGRIAGTLQQVLTATNFFDTDLRCIDLLERHVLCDRAWLKQWLDFKRSRLRRHLTFADAVADRLSTG